VSVAIEAPMLLALFMCFLLQAVGIRLESQTFVVGASRKILDVGDTRSAGSVGIGFVVLVARDATEWASLLLANHHAQRILEVLYSQSII
jgi:hypothetical protein